jgi:hypothetical protein
MQLAHQGRDVASGVRKCLIHRLFLYLDVTHASVQSTVIYLCSEKLPISNFMKLLIKNMYFKNQMENIMPSCQDVANIFFKL